MVISRGFMRKKGTLLALILGLLLVLSGCGTKAVEDNTPVAKKKVIIGGSLDMSGQAGAYGLSFKKSVELAIEELNAASTKYEFSLDMLDDRSTVAVFSSNLDRLFAETKFMLAGNHVGEGPVAAEFALKNKLLIIAASQTDPSTFTIAPNNIFSGVLPSNQHGKAMATYVVSKGYKKVALLVPKNQYGKDIASGVTDELKAKGVTIVYTEEIPTASVDVRPQATKVKDSGADVLVTANYGDVTALLAKTLNEVGYKTAIVGSTAVQSESYLKLAGTAAEGTVALTEAPADGWQKAVDFGTAFEKKFGEKPLSPFANAAFYDTTMMLGMAIEKAGPDNVDKVIEAYKTMKFDGAGGPALQYKGNMLDKKTSFMIVTSGKWVRVAQ